MIATTQECTITQVADPAAYYTRNADQLAAVGADAFSQPVETFASGVEERFGKSSLAQIMQCGNQIVGFALYDVIRGSHWRLTVN